MGAKWRTKFLGSNLSLSPTPLPSDSGGKGMGAWSQCLSLKTWRISEAIVLGHVFTNFSTNKGEKSIAFWLGWFENMDGCTYTQENHLWICIIFITSSSSHVTPCVWWHIIIQLEFCKKMKCWNLHCLVHILFIIRWGFPNFQTLASYHRLLHKRFCYL